MTDTPEELAISSALDRAERAEAEAAETRRVADRLAAHLERALSQWEMYADEHRFGEEDSIVDADDEEAKRFEAAWKDLRKWEDGNDTTAGTAYRARLEAAEWCGRVLETLEWCHEVNGRGRCLGCFNVREEGHHEDCHIGQALAAWKEARHE